MSSFVGNLHLFNAQINLCNSANRLDGWMYDLRFNILFNKSILVISGRKEVDDERLYAMESRLRLSKFRLKRGSNSEPLDP